ncbi:hypothetical protein J6S55_01710 [Candidatus Saccharibacteria bacterium]|nr:hypothetical protein [Candidatus Saccharibacteria bacterium]
MKKRGAASFYIVAFSTLILTVIATSFAMVIVSEITRSMNDDLSQSAYDSALAGVEDAKVAYSNYRRCKEAGAVAAATKPSGAGSVTCGDILYWVEKEPDSCYTVARILGRIGKDEEKEVGLGGTEVSGTGGVKTTNQAYTCVKMKMTLNDYRATLSDNNAVRTVKAGVSGDLINDISKIRISWYSNRSNFSPKWNNQNKFPTIQSLAAPPTLEFKLVQTAEEFRLADFDLTGDGVTDRATLYLVPQNSTGTNFISKNDVVKTNNRAQTNKPFKVNCKDGQTSEFYCSVDIELPSPAASKPLKTDVEGGDIDWSEVGDGDSVIFGGNQFLPIGELIGIDEPALPANRNSDTFMFTVSLPYRQPETDFAIEVFCNTSSTKCAEVLGGAGESTDKAVTMSDVQISIDSTGRANDLYRRVETRLETSDATYASSFPYYALQILDKNKETKKNMTVNYECNFYDKVVGDFSKSNC